MKKLAAAAKKAKTGIWAKDETEDGLTVNGNASLESSVIWLKFYRRV